MERRIKMLKGVISINWIQSLIFQKVLKTWSDWCLTMIPKRDPLPRKFSINMSSVKNKLTWNGKEFLERHSKVKRNPLNNNIKPSKIEESQSVKILRDYFKFFSILSAKGLFKRDIFVSWCLILKYTNKIQTNVFIKISSDM